MLRSYDMVFFPTDRRFLESKWEYSPISTEYPSRMVFQDTPMYSKLRYEECMGRGVSLGNSLKVTLFWVLGHRSRGEREQIHEVGRLDSALDSPSMGAVRVPAGST